MKPLVLAHFNALKVAESCLSWGARLQTIQYLTGLHRHTLTQLANATDTRIPIGRPSDGYRWYLHADLLGRLEACVFIAHFSKLRSEKFGPVESILSAYGSVAGLALHDRRLEFDHAFDVAAKVEGRWRYIHPWLEINTCGVCECQHIQSISAKAPCPFCELIGQQAGSSSALAGQLRPRKHSSPSALRREPMADQT